MTQVTSEMQTCTSILPSSGSKPDNEGKYVVHTAADTAMHPTTGWSVNNPANNILHLAANFREIWISQLSGNVEHLSDSWMPYQPVLWTHHCHSAPSYDSPSPLTLYGTSPPLCLAFWQLWTAQFAANPYMSYNVNLNCTTPDIFDQLNYLGSQYQGCHRWYVNRH